MARPSIFTPELGDKICEQIALGKSMRTICESDAMPAISTVFSWFRTNQPFLEQYARAKKESTSAHEDYLLDIADDGRNDFMEDNYNKGKTPGYQLNGENIQRSKLRVDTRKWLMSKLEPKKYGDKLDVTSDGKALPQPIYGGLSVKDKDGA
jgi:hypothetical protein